MTVVITGFSPSGYKEYGKRFLDTFDKHWPRDVKLIYYVEEPVSAPRGVCQMLHRCAGADAFLKRHENNPAAHGKVKQPCWRPKDVSRGYTFKTDAYKFFKQCLIPEDAAGRMGDDEIMVWLDADVMTLADVPADFVEGLLDKADIVYLGRERIHSEIGFWAVRLNKRTRAFLHELAETYRSDAFFKLREWHSAFVFDDVLAVHKACGLRAKNLTPGGTGHVWVSSPLNAYLDHLKGQRKALGASPERAHRK